MEKDFKINIKYTLKDIRNFSFARAYQGIFSKISLFFSGFLAILFLVFAIPMILFFRPEDVDFFLIVLLPMLIAILASSLPAIIIYLIQRDNFKKSKILGNLQCMEFMNDVLKISSDNSCFSVKWEDIYKVVEFKPCFLIYISPGKYFIVPRRCFSSDEQLKDFLDILTSKVDKIKVKLKKYKLGKICPDIGTVKVADEVIAPNEVDNILPLFEVNFTLKKKELLETNYKLYYTSRNGIVSTIIGILLLSLFGKGVLGGNISIMTLMILFVFGVLFTIWVPIVLYINTGRQFGKDAALTKPYNYKFYDDYYIINHPDATSRISWVDLVKIIELKSIFLFFNTTQIAHLIPKRVFEGNEDVIKFIKEIKRQIKKNNKGRSNFIKE